MKIQVDITTPTTTRTDIRWHAPVHPAIGDAVLFRQGDLCWTFRVKDRHIGTGTDPNTGDPLVQIGLHVDTEAPPGWSG